MIMGEWRTSGTLKLSGTDTVKVTVFGWDLSQPPVEMAASLIPPDVLYHGARGGKIVFWVEPQADGSLILSRFALPPGS